MPGPPIQLITLIVLTKGLAGPGCLILALYYQNFTLPCAIQMAIRGVYGVAWICQHFAFPTKTWDHYPNWTTFLFVGTWLGIMVPMIDVLCIANTTTTNTTTTIEQDEVSSSSSLSSFWITFATVFLFSLGLLLMMVTDSTTRIILKHRKGLITTGFNKYIRHPNYLGETLIYASFCINSRSLYAWIIMAFGWMTMVIPSMMRKEKSLSRYGKEWERYCEQAGLMWPKL